MKKEAKEEKTERGLEDKLDAVMDRFSKSLTEAAKRIEDAFEKSKEGLKESKIISEKYKSVFGTPTGGFILTVFGFAWLLYTLGAFNQPIFPVILILLGLYMMVRRRGD